MNRYTIFHLSSSGDVVEKEELDLLDDLDALDHAKKVCAGRDVEVWEGTRLAVHIDTKTGEGILGPVPEGQSPSP